MATSFDESILAVFACLRPNGAIEVELLIPENDEPSIVEIPTTATTKRLAVPNERRVIDLDADWDNDNKTLRGIVNEFVRRAEQRRLDALRVATTRR